MRRTGARGLSRAALAALVAAAAGSPAAAPARAAEEAAPARFARHLEREGVAVELEIKALRGAAALREGEPVAVRFRVTDTHTGQPLSSLYPAAWMDRLPAVPEERPDPCKRKVESFVGGTLLARPELDLNVYYVLALNDDATVSVVDPLFGFGGSKLLAMVFLSAPGYDWALAADQRLLFVSLPDADRVAVVSTIDWEVIAEVEVGPRPGRLALQPDGARLWVAYRGPLPGGGGSGLSGVSVIDVAGLARIADVETGPGDHDLAFDGRGHAFVTNRADGTVTVVDTGTLAAVRRLETAPDPVSLAYSRAAGAVYVSHGASGVIAAIDAERLEVVARIAAAPGLGEIRFAPGGRLAFVVNPEEDVVHVVDAAARRIVQTADVEEGPDHVGFSDELAYVRHRGSETVLMIPLGEVGREGAPVPVVDFPGGQLPPGRTDSPTPAAGIVQAPGATAVLVANPLDGAIYYYKEGMAAPMGHFKNYGRQPRAVLVVDRSLRETAPGLYETAVALRRPGAYDLAFFLDSPRIVHCFGFRVAENPELAARRRLEREPVEVHYRLDGAGVAAGEEVALRFELAGALDRQPLGGRKDVEVLTFLAPGIWQQRHLAEPREGGLYEVRFTPPRPGVYYVFVQSRSLGFDYRRSPYVALLAREAAPGAAAGVGGPQSGTAGETLQ